MAHDVFISYSTKDKPAADAVCARLEGRGIRCWIAPRDILPGTDWGASIVEALESARLMVVVFSSHANASLQIRREVECAFSKEIMVVPLRIEDVPPGRSLEYFLGNVHWLDAIGPPFEKHLDRIGDTIKLLIGRMPDAAGEPASRAAASTESEAGAEQARRAAAAANVNQALAEEASAAKREGRLAPPSIAEKPQAVSKSAYRWIAIGLGLIFAVLVLANLLERNRREETAATFTAASAQSSPAAEQNAAVSQGPSPAAQAQSSADDPARHARDEAAFCANFKDCAATLTEFRNRATQGNADAQSKLGDMYYYGYGVAPDYAQALNWYRQAAAQGHPYGQYSVGYLYQYGQGVEKNYTEALSWFRKAAAQGNRDAQCHLGDMYYYGYGVEPDFSQALNWYRQAAAQGSAYGQYSIGYMYQNGRGVERSDEQALTWYRKAAAQGNAAAQKAVDQLSASGH